MTESLLFRALTAAMYSFVMLVDITFELTGRYARSGVGLTRIPYLEQHKTGNAISWAGVHIFMALWLLDDGWHGWTYAPFFAMAGFLFLALKRIGKTLS